MMHKITLTEYLFVILAVLILALGLSYGMQSWLTQVHTETGQKIERASRIFQ